MKKSVLVVLGTRPELIKLVPVIKALQADSDLRVVICNTAQHKDLLEPFLKLFELSPDFDLDVMTDNQSLEQVTSSVLTRFSQVLESTKPDRIIVQGDTTTAFACGLGAFYKGIPLGHVEAGLRTHDLQQPFPEELNRQLISRFAKYHFTPTKVGTDNLILEGIPNDDIYETGNTIIDAIMLIDEKVNLDKVKLPFLQKENVSNTVLLTCHRRENFGDPIKNIFEAVNLLADQHPHLTFVFPAHPNPNVQLAIKMHLAEKPNIVIIEPLGYIELLALLKCCRFVLSDSGGIQEEALAFNKKVLVLREKTERPEGVDVGTSTLVGSDKSKIVDEANAILSSNLPGKVVNNPYGDGKASERIVKIIKGVKS